MTLHDDTTAKDALITHLERELKEARMTLRDQFAIASASAGTPPRMVYAMADEAMEARKK